MHKSPKESGVRNHNERGYKPSLVILATRKHDDVGRRRLGRHGASVGILPSGGLLEEAQNIVGHAAEIALAVGGDGTEKTLAGLLGEIGLLEDALGGVDVGKIEGGTRMARVEDGCETHAARQGSHHDAVHLVVGNVSDLSEIDRVDDLVETVFFVAIEVLGLATVP